MCHTDQTKGSQDWKTLDVLQAELDQTQNDDYEIEATPLVLKVFVQTKRNDLENRFDRENAREHLNTSKIAATLR